MTGARAAEIPDPDRQGRERLNKEQEANRPTRNNLNEAEATRPPPRKRRSNRTTSSAMHAAEQAYKEETSEDIRQVLEGMEARVLDEPSDPEMNEWASQLPDPGHTHGRLTLYRRALHTYWVLKHLLAKALEQVASEMLEIAQASAIAQQEASILAEQVRQQTELLKEIRAMLKELQQDRASRASERGLAEE